MTTEVCPYCRGPISTEESVTTCEGCGTQHHADCYQENGGCTIFGCSCAPAEEPKLSVSVPELVSVAAQANPLSSVVVPAPPPRPGQVAEPAPATVEELQSITNQVVPSMFGSFAGYDTTSAAPMQDSPPPGPPRSRTTFIVLGALLGAFGAHNFYASYTKKAVAQLAITVLTLGFGSPMSWIWAIIDVCTVDHDSQGVQFES